MNYRIRYREQDIADENEALIEANSPNEALVKFRCAVNSDSRVVMSVSAELHDVDNIIDNIW